jgi:hypothetical protein
MRANRLALFIAYQTQPRDLRRVIISLPCESPNARRTCIFNALSGRSRSFVDQPDALLFSDSLDQLLVRARAATGKL